MFRLSCHQFNYFRPLYQMSGEPSDTAEAIGSDKGQRDMKPFQLFERKRSDHGFCFRTEFSADNRQPECRVGPGERDDKCGIRNDVDVLFAEKKSCYLRGGGPCLDHHSISVGYHGSCFSSDSVFLCRSHLLPLEKLGMKSRHSTTACSQ